MGTRTDLCKTLALCVAWAYLYQIFYLLILLAVVYKIVDVVLRWPRLVGYEDRYVLVTGTRSGLGRACAKRLDQLGCHVFACYVLERGNQELSLECSERLQLVPLDVSKPESVRTAFEFVKSKLPEGKGLWGLVNNAGIVGKRGHLEWTTVDDFKEVNAVNLYGVIDMTLTFLPLIKKERGRIVNVSSMAGVAILPVAASYTLSKVGVECFSDILRFSLKQFGCRVSIIEPAGFATRLNRFEETAESFNQTWRSVPEEIKQEFGEEYFRQFRDQCCSRLLPSPSTSQAIRRVTDVFEKALFCRNPHERYPVNLSYNPVIQFIPFLPAWIQDRILSVIFKMYAIVPSSLKN